MEQRLRKDTGFLKTVVETFEREEKIVALRQKKPEENPFEPKAFPPLVQVGLTNVCNLACRECYHPLFKEQRDYKPIFMSRKVFSKIVDEVETFPSSVIFRFLGKGESLH